MNLILGILDPILYLATSTLIWMRLKEYPIPVLAIRTLWLGALIIHAKLVISILFVEEGMDLGLFKSGLASSFLIATVLYFSCLYKSIDSVALLILPITAVFTFLGLTYFSDVSQHIVATETVLIKIHILSSLLAYSVLSVAVMLAVLLHFQSVYLHQAKIKSPLKALPALDAGESFLFNLILLSLLLLTLSLTTGWSAHENLMAQHLMHKTILSICAWIVLLTLSSGCWFFGWRGTKLLKLILTGAILLLLAYFGSKVVLELILI